MVERGGGFGVEGGRGCRDVGLYSSDKTHIFEVGTHSVETYGL